MAMDCLGHGFDIHGGGMDLQFPHHENEIAQSCAATDKDYARVWMHNGFVNIDQQKMSKSLGNFLTIRQILKKYPGEVIRFFMLSSHYRSPLHYADEQLQTAAQGLERLYLALRGSQQPLVEKEELATHSFSQRFTEAMDDDFNTPQAVAVLFDLAREINRLKQAGEQQQVAELTDTLKGLGAVLGILQQSPEDFLQGSKEQRQLSLEQIEDLIHQRQQARQNKDWALADQLRDQLEAAGIILEDGSQGTSWRQA
jgi:cysteinyl-tRNA synthetase